MIKKSIGVLLCAAMMFSVVGCSKTATDGNNSGTVQESQETSSDVSVKDLVSSVINAEYIRAALEVDEQTAVDAYHINLEDVEEYAIAETQISPGPGFMVAVKAKEGKLDAVKEAVEKIKSDLVGKAFYPAEQEAAEKATVKVSGNIVYLTLFNDEVASDAEALIESTLNK